MSDGHRLHTIELGLETYEQELLQDPGFSDAYVAFEVRNLEQKNLLQDRLLTEVDHLISLRKGTRQYGDTSDVSQNMETSMQEQAMPFAVTTTEHEIEVEARTNERIVRWLGRTAVQVAASGYKFHKHQSALERVGVEIEEAYRASSHHDDGTMRVFVSPRMSRKDASLAVARSEHLGDDDAVRVSWVKTLEDGTQKRVLQSLLVRDIPLSAWVALFEDSNSIFGKSMNINDPESALSIMKLHNQLDIDMSKLPNGPVSLIEAVIPYIDDVTTRRKVIDQSKKYYGDQQQMKQEAQSKAEEWLAFDIELAEGLVTGYATTSIQAFLGSLEQNWGKEDYGVLSRHFEASTGRYKMTRELAAMLESAQQKLLAGRAALTTNVEHVLKKLGGDRAQLERMQVNERVIAQAWHDGLETHRLLAIHNRNIASRNIDGGGGGCAGSSSTEFGDAPDKDLFGNETSPSELTDANSVNSEGSGACEYSGTFCYCCPYNSDGSDASKLYEVTIVRDEDGVAKCTRSGCGATMKGDRVTDLGGIYKRAQERRGKNEK